MTTFLLAAAALTAVTIALLLVPLLRRRAAAAATSQSEVAVAVLRDQLADLDRERSGGAIDAAAYAAAERDLKQRILADALPDREATDRAARGAALALALVLPLAAAGLYAWLGEPDALDPRTQSSQARHADAGQMEAVVAKLAQRLQSTPEDLQGWEMLARSYRAMGRHADAVAAFARAEKRIAGDAQRLAEWAESLAMARGGKLAGEPSAMIARALAVDPNGGHALALAGAAAFEAGDWKQAIAHWERLAGQFAPASEDAETIRRSIAAARESLAKAGGSVAAAPAQKPEASAAPSAANVATFRLSGTVSLAPALAARASPNDAVFIFARAANGPPMPIAAIRRQVKDLPVRFTLDEASAMLDRVQLAGVGEVIVGARISRSGDVVARSGDLQGLARPVRIGAEGIQVVIDGALP